jgi:hypothetical protein
LVRPRAAHDAFGQTDDRSNKFATLVCTSKYIPAKVVAILYGHNDFPLEVNDIGKLRTITSRLIRNMYMTHDLDDEPDGDGVIGSVRDLARRIFNRIRHHCALLQQLNLKTIHATILPPSKGHGSRFATGTARADGGVGDNKHV